MVVRLLSDLRSRARGRASTAGAAFALFLAGCAGNVLVGAPLDGGDDLEVVDPIVEVRDSGVRDTRPAASDAGGAGPSRDAVVPPSSGPVDSGSGPAAVVDSGRPPVVATDAGVPAPSGGRDFSTDRARFIGAPRCNLAGALFCDDFEGQPVGSMPGPAWKTPYGMQGKIDSTHFLRGGKSLLFEVGASMPGHIEETMTFPAANNTIFGRMFLWIEQLPTAPANARWTVVGARGVDDATGPTEVRIGGQIYPDRESKNYFGVGSDYGESGTWHTAGKETQSTVREKDWICLEWEFKGDTSETNVWIDAVKQESLHLTSTEYRDGDAEAGKKFTHPTFGRMRIGWWLYQGNATPATSKVWIDELIIDKARIGCVL